MASLGAQTRAGFGHAFMSTRPIATGFIDFASMGLILQAITEKTARVVMVVDDERARKNLAIYLAAYEYWGYTLLIDEATFARPAVLESEPDASSNDLTTSETSVDTLGMEVA